MTLDLSRDQILSYRRRVSAMEERLPHSVASLERVAAAGLQDSMPRAALLSIHARVSATMPDTWREPPLVQVWGPRFSAFVIAESDLAVFTLGRLPAEPKALRRAVETADRLEEALDGMRMDVRDAARKTGMHPNALRYASPTGRFLIHWDGARQPLIWSRSAPDVDPFQARLELARRYLHALGPAARHSFASWAGMGPKLANETFDALAEELIPVGTPIGEATILASDAHLFGPNEPAHATRLLPSGDSYYLLQGADRELLVPDRARRDQLWTSRVWPGAVVHHGEIVGTWRRSQNKVTIEPWEQLGRASREVIEKETTDLPIPGTSRSITVSWV